MRASGETVMKVRAAVVAVALLAVACGGGADGDSTAGGQQGEASGSDAGPRYGGTLVVAALDPGRLNPALTPSGTTHPVTGQIFNGLIRLDRNFDPVPDLAQTWEVTPDGKTYTFKLAEGVRWHDGTPFTSADVKFTYEQVLLKLHPRTRTLAQVIEGIDTPDDTTVVFRLKNRYTPFVLWLDEDNGAILPKHLYEGTDPLTNPANAKPIGTGPFKLESSKAGDTYTLVRNPHYFKDGLPYLDRIVFRVILAPPQAVQALEAGEVNMLLYPDPAQVNRLEALPGVVVSEDGREGFARVIRLIPNLRREPFDDVRVRRAIAYAIDRDVVASAGYAGTMAPATGPVSRGLTEFYTDDVAKYPRDLDKAKALLDEAGLEPGPDGVRLRISLLYDMGFSRPAEILKEQLKDVGIELNLILMEFNAWVKKLYIDWDFELGYSQFTDPPDPDIGLRGRFECANVVKAPFANGGGYCNPKVDELFQKAASEPDHDTRVEMYHEVQRIIAEDQNQIFLVDGIGSTARQEEFQGFADAGSKGPYYFGETMWWTKAQGTSVPSP